MPYITPEYREHYEPELDALIQKFMLSGDKESTSCFAGHLNYVITSLITRVYTDYLKKEGGLNLNYSDHNEIIGLLECAKMEFYRRKTAPYEDKKIKENGDV